jgi:hypothetical protein
MLDDLDFERPARRRAAARPDRRPRDPGAVTEVLRDRPSWEGDPPDSRRRSDAGAPDPPTERLDDSGTPRRRNGAGEPPATDRLF